MAKADAGLLHAPTLLTDFFAFFLRQAGQVVVKIAQSLALPMKLHGVALHPPQGLRGLQIRFAGKEQVQRGQFRLLAPRQYRLTQPTA